MLASALREIHTLASRHPIHDIFVCGDLLEHEFPKEFHRRGDREETLTEFSGKTIVYLLRQFSMAANDASVHFSSGNNDADTDHYEFPGKGFFAEVARGIFPEQSGRPYRTFATAGYSRTSLRNGSIEVIALNANLFVDGHVVPELAEKQLSWLRADLENCHREGHHVIILQHEPFGIDPNTSSRENPPVPFFDPEWQRRYLGVILRYAGDITLSCNGHLHMETFQSLDGKIPAIGTVALNSRRRNNPGSKVLSINDSNGKPTDYATYCFDLSTAHPQWSLLYRCASTYHLGHNSLLNRINNFPAAVGNPMVISYRESFNPSSAL